LKVENGMQSNGGNIGVDGHLFYLGKASLQIGNVSYKCRMAINHVMIRKAAKKVSTSR